MQEISYKVYAKLNEENYVTEINSEIFIDDFSGWTLIDEGVGNKYAHAQSSYLEKPIINGLGNYNYKFINGEIVEAL